ncbi:MAG: phage antirepressor N-terminal domain-containing protein [Anaerolineae bacterium]
MEERVTDNIALVPIETRAVELEGDELIAVLVEKDGKQVIYVPINPLVEHLGLAPRSQRRRINEDPVLSEVAETVRVERPAGKGGGTQEMLCLPLTFINGFLFGISASRVKEELRAKVIQYQRDCYNALAEAFGVSETGIVARGHEETTLSPRIASLAQIRDVSLAVAQMAQEMILHEQQLEDHDVRISTVEARLTDAARYVGGVERRLQVVEERTAPRGVVSEDEADEIRAKVVALANLIVEQQAEDEKSKKQQRAPYQTVYHTVYTHFSVSSYKRIRKEDYGKVLEFLDGWKNRILASEERSGT